MWCHSWRMRWQVGAVVFATPHRLWIESLPWDVASALCCSSRREAASSHMGVMGRADRLEGDGKAMLSGTGKFYQEINMTPSILHASAKHCHRKPPSLLLAWADAILAGTILSGTSLSAAATAGPLASMELLQFAPSLCFYQCLA